MKKSLVAVLAVILCFIGMISFAGCDKEPEKEIVSQVLTGKEYKEGYTWTTSTVTMVGTTVIITPVIHTVSDKYYLYLHVTYIDETTAEKKITVSKTVYENTKIGEEYIG